MKNVREFVVGVKCSFTTCITHLHEVADTTLNKMLNFVFPVIWQWKTNTNPWTSFSAGACRNLDAAVQLELKTASFEDEKNQYSVNMVTKELVNNTSKEKGSARHIIKEVAG